MVETALPTASVAWCVLHCAAAVVDADVPMADAEEQDATAAAAAAVAGDGVEGPVCAEQQESLLGVQLKVEVLTALVSKMEHLVSRAEATARALQVGERICISF